MLSALVGRGVLLDERDFHRVNFIPVRSSRLAPRGVYTFVLMNHAWRNVRSRGWRAALTIALLALALAANTIVFSAADSFVLHRLPYADPDRLVEIPSRDPADRSHRQSFHVGRSA